MPCGRHARPASPSRAISFLIGRRWCQGGIDSVVVGAVSGLVWFGLACGTFDWSRGRLILPRQVKVTPNLKARDAARPKCQRRSSMRRGRARPLRCRGWLICGACREAACLRAALFEITETGREVCCISSFSGLFRPVVVTMPVTRTVLPRQFGSCRSAPAESVMEVLAVLKPGNDSRCPHNSWRCASGHLTANSRWMATVSSLATRISPRVQSGQADRRVVNEAPQRIGSSLRLSQHAFSPTSNTHTIAARSLGRGMPPWSHGPGSCLSTRRACLADG